MCESAAVPVVDVHQHLWPAPLVDVLAGRRRPPRLAGATLELVDGSTRTVDLAAHDGRTRIALLDHAGIDVALVSLPPTLGAGVLPEEEWDELAAAYERGMGELAEASGRILPLAARRDSEGFVGTCVSAHELLDLERLATLLDALELRDAFLFVHPGPSLQLVQTPTWWAAVVEHTAQMQAAYAAWLDRGVKRWPRLQVVFAILAGGGPIQLERLQSQGIAGRDSLPETVYFDTASYGRRALELCLSTLGVGRVLFGSNTPALTPEEGLDAIRGFGDAVMDAVCDRNPSRLLGQEV